MGSIEKRAKRAQAKRSYKSFVREWKRVRRHQDSLSKTGSRFDLSNEQVLELQKAGTPVLGKRPTFNQWWASVKRFAAFKATPEEVQEHIDLTWDDE